MWPLLDTLARNAEFSGQNFWSRLATFGHFFILVTFCTRLATVGHANFYEFPRILVASERYGEIGD